MTQLGVIFFWVKTWNSWDSRTKHDHLNDVIRFNQNRPAKLGQNNRFSCTWKCPNCPRWQQLSSASIFTATRPIYNEWGPHWDYHLLMWGLALSCMGTNGKSPFLALCVEVCCATTTGIWFPYEMHYEEGTANWSWFSRHKYRSWSLIMWYHS